MIAHEKEKNWHTVHILPNAEYNFCKGVVPVWEYIPFFFFKGVPTIFIFIRYGNTDPIFHHWMDDSSNERFGSKCIFQWGKEDNILNKRKTSGSGEGHIKGI